jgi:hypothetical protein
VKNVIQIISNFFLCSLFIHINLLSDDDDNYQWREDTAYKNIQETLEDRLTYFMHSWYDIQGSKEAENIIQEVIHDSLHNPDNFKQICRKFYCKEKLIEDIFNSVIKKIEKKTYNYVLNKMHSHSTAHRIAKHIIHELQEKDVYSYNYSKYLGEALYNRIDAKILEIESLFKFYPSDECCICYSPFDAIKCKQVFLQPCGHDICKNCFKDYHQKCALCQSRVEDWIESSNTPGCNPYN